MLGCLLALCVCVAIMALAAIFLRSILVLIDVYIVVLIGLGVLYTMCVIAEKMLNWYIRSKGKEVRR